MWEAAYASLDDYYKLYGKVYSSFNLENATNYKTTGTWVPETTAKKSTTTSTSKKSLGSTTTTTPKNTAASSTAVTKAVTTAAKTTTTATTKTTTSSGYKASDLAKLKTYSVVANGLALGSKGQGVALLQYFLNQVGYYGSKGQTTFSGVFDQATLTALNKFQDEVLNYSWRKDVRGIVGGDTKWWMKLWQDQGLAEAMKQIQANRGYRSGTSHAAPGLHRIDENGDEFVFTSSNGNRYRLFSGGEKVLTASETNFLYAFAKAGNGILGNVIKGASNAGALNSISNTKAIGDIRMGDIIIQGNADQKTVSQIRREQRESMDYLLTQFAHMQA